MANKTHNTIINATTRLSDELDFVRTKMPLGPACYVLDPTRYALANYSMFMQRVADGPRPLLFVGMNPGPYGMAQTGMPFGDVVTARRLLDKDLPGEWPTITSSTTGDELWRRNGLQHSRVEESGRRLWSALETFVGGGSLSTALARVCVINYCPLFFVDAFGRNKTPADLPRRDERTLRIERACDEHMRVVIDAVQPVKIFTLGWYADDAVLRTLGVVSREKAKAPDRDGPTYQRVTRLPHPSPQASTANEWLGKVAPIFAELSTAVTAWEAAR